MPIYEYRCPDGHQFEVMQSMTDDPVSACEVCDKPVERVFHPIAVHFKGSGFYTTDYAKKGSGASSSDGGAKADSDSGSSESKPTAPPKSGSESSSSSKSTSAD